jgi:hypothetical protein
MPSWSASREDAVAGADSSPAAAIEAMTAATRRGVEKGVGDVGMAGSAGRGRRTGCALPWSVGSGERGMDGPFVPVGTSTSARLV